MNLDVLGIAAMVVMTLVSIGMIVYVLAWHWIISREFRTERPASCKCGICDSCRLRNRLSHQQQEAK